MFIGRLRSRPIGGGSEVDGDLYIFGVVVVGSIALM